jgi:hypothetical protein
MNVIYGVTQGEYSDYEVVALFTTPEKRDAFIAAFSKTSGNYGIPEARDFDLDPDPPVEVEAIRVIMNKAGDVIDVPELHTSTLDKIGFVIFRSSGGSAVDLCWRVATTDPERAIKAVNEKRTQIIAADAWGDNRAVRAMFARCVADVRGY